MASLRELRTKVKSVKSTQQITKAMKLVAAARLNKAQERIMAARPFADRMERLLSEIAYLNRAGGGSLDHPFLQKRLSDRIDLVLVTADRGLCGAFNTNVIRAAQNAIAEKGWPEVHLTTIGSKATGFFKRRPQPKKFQTTLLQALAPESIREIATSIAADFISGEFDAVYVLYNEFKSIIAQRVTLDRLLPLERPEVDEAAPAVEYIFAPGPEQILPELLPKHIEFQIYRVLLESAAAEQGARMTAMEAATKNASEMISHLTLTYNRIRQASITKEIIEIVSGAAAAGK